MMHIIARHKKKEKCVNMFFGSINEAKKHNLKFIDFRAVIKK